MDVLTIPDPGACISGSEVELSVLESEAADTDSADFCRKSDTEVERWLLTSELGCMRAHDTISQRLDVGGIGC
jgi:hypothetical protein